MNIEALLYWSVIGSVIEATMTSIIIIIIIECEAPLPGIDPEIILPTTVRIVDKTACVIGAILGGLLFAQFVLQAPEIALTNIATTGIGAVLGSLTSLEIAFYTIGLRVLRSPKSLKP